MQFTFPYFFDNLMFIYKRPPKNSKLRKVHECCLVIARSRKCPFRENNVHTSCFVWKDRFYWHFWKKTDFTIDLQYVHFLHQVQLYVGQTNSNEFYLSVLPWYESNKFQLFFPFTILKWKGIWTDTTLMFFDVLSKIKLNEKNSFIYHKKRLFLVILQKILFLLSM